MKSLTLPIIEYGKLADSSETLLKAMVESGAFLLRAPNMASSMKEMIDCSSELFSLPRETKESHMLDKDSKFTGFSNLQNDRDHREQFHLFSNFDCQYRDDSYPCSRLKYPNLVPEALSDQWKATVSSYMEEMNDIARSILDLIASENGFNDQFGASSGPLSYCLLKFINYFPNPDQLSRGTGTPPHIDWSLITIVLRQNAPGFFLKLDEWVELGGDDASRNDCFLIMVGELLEIISGGRFKAAPHKVTLPKHVKSRVSLPYFYAPDLDSTIKIGNQFDNVIGSDCDEHIHRVTKPAEISGDFHFGGTELNRKLLGRWCHDVTCCN